MPKVSVIIPAYNYAKFVGRAMQSVLDQTMTDLELILVDDGSTDQTREVVLTFDDPRVTYIYQENRGLPATRNTGIQAASGEYVAFLDADDAWMPDKLEKQLPLLDRYPKVGLVCGGYLLVDEHENVLATRQATGISGNILDRLVKGNIVTGSASTSVVRRECFDRVGLFDESLRACEDWDMWLRIARYAEFASVQQPIAKLRWHGSNMGTDNKRMESAMFTVLEKMWADPELPEEIKSLKQKALAGAHHDIAVISYRRSGQLRQAVGHLVRAIMLNPTWLNPYIVLARFLLGMDSLAPARHSK